MDSTVNPPATFPPPVTVQVDEDRSVDGADESTHAVSVVNPEAAATTTVPGGPETGVSVKGIGGLLVTAKVAEAESLAPKFDVTVTV